MQRTSATAMNQRTICPKLTGSSPNALLRTKRLWSQSEQKLGRTAKSQGELSQTSKGSSQIVHSRTRTLWSQHDQMIEETSTNPDAKSPEETLMILVPTFQRSKRWIPDARLLAVTAWSRNWQSPTLTVKILIGHSCGPTRRSPRWRSPRSKVMIPVVPCRKTTMRSLNVHRIAKIVTIPGGRNPTRTSLSLVAPCCEWIQMTPHSQIPKQTGKIPRKSSPARTRLNRNE